MTQERWSSTSARHNTNLEPGGALHHARGVLRVALDPVVHHCGPGGGDQRAVPRASKAGGNVQTARPIANARVLVPPYLWRAIQDHRGSLVGAPWRVWRERERVRVRERERERVRERE